MTSSTTPAQASAPQPQPKPSRRGFGVFILLVAVVTPIAILIASNTDSSEIAWGGWEWVAPRWLVLIATFFAGVIGGKLFGWLWRSWRRRRRRIAEQRDLARRVVGGQGG